MSAFGKRWATQTENVRGLHGDQSQLRNDAVCSHGTRDTEADPTGT
jgi:hypothetical protein